MFAKPGHVACLSSKLRLQFEYHDCMADFHPSMCLKFCARMIETGLEIPEEVGWMVRRDHIGSGMDILANSRFDARVDVTPNLLHSQRLKFEYEYINKQNARISSRFIAALSSERV